MIEDGEIKRHWLNDYFTGELIQYKLSFLQDRLMDPEERDRMIYLQNYHETFDSHYIEEESYKVIDVEPFPQSSLILEEKSNSKLEQYSNSSLYVVTKNLTFIQFDLSGFHKQT